VLWLQHSPLLDSLVAAQSSSTTTIVQCRMIEQQLCDRMIKQHLNEEMKVNYIAKTWRKLDLNSNSSYLVMGSHL
jgi:hypothetical protein